jgi:hypothetical protein
MSVSILVEQQKGNGSWVGTAADLSPDVTRASFDSTTAQGFARASAITYASQSTFIP